MKASHLLTLAQFSNFNRTYSNENILFSLKTPSDENSVFCVFNMFYLAFYSWWTNIKKINLKIAFCKCFPIKIVVK